MNWLEQERFYKNQRREKDQQEAEATDRQLNPWLYQAEDVPAVWNRGDLWEGDHKRDYGK